MSKQYQVGIIGGGLAGLCTALHLHKLGISCVLWEKGEYPRHKVCGEYVSNETLDYLKFLGYDPFQYGAVAINEFTMTHWNGKKTFSKLDQGAFGISRFSFDHALYQIGIQNGAAIHLSENVTGFKKNKEGFEVKTNKDTYQVKLLVSGHGKKSNMDRIMEREFFQKDNDFIGVKYHFEYSIPSNMVYLHHFETGYCGVSMVENKVINVCYLSTKSALKKYGDIPGLEENLVLKNPYLKEVFTTGKKLFDEPKVISDFSFKPKKPVEKHVFMVGDAAGLITPLCGNGMAMAIHSAFILCTLMKDHFAGKISVAELEQQYAENWKHQFKSRLSTGYKVQKLTGKKGLTSIAFTGFQVAPFMLSTIIRKTHGENFFHS